MKSANKLYSSYRNKTLRSILRSKGLKVSGTKSELVQRLIDYEKTKTKKVAAAAPISRLPVISEEPKTSKTKTKKTKKKNKTKKKVAPLKFPDWFESHSSGWSEEEKLEEWKKLVISKGDQKTWYKHKASKNKSTTTDLPPVIMTDREKKAIVKRYLSTDDWKKIIAKEKENNTKVWLAEEVRYRNTPSSKRMFDTLEEGFIWDSITKKKCSVCKNIFPLTNYGTNTSGSDHFNSMKSTSYKKGIRRRRPECNTCKKAVNDGIGKARKLAERSNLDYKAPKGIPCAICGKIHERMVFDHCHKKNIFRGYLCDPCNRSLGILGDDIPNLTNAINYLMRTEGGRMKILPNGSLKWIPQGSRRPSSK